jgi:hypothetical protein
MKRDAQSRSFFIEIPYSLFVLFVYPASFKEFLWGVLMHFVRIYTWLLIFYKRVLRKEGMPENGWERIPSTK